MGKKSTIKVNIWPLMVGRGAGLGWVGGWIGSGQLNSDPTPAPGPTP